MLADLWRLMVALCDVRALARFLTPDRLAITVLGTASHLKRELAEKAGKTITPMLVVSNEPFYAITQAAQAVGDGKAKNLLIVYPTGNLEGRYHHSAPEKTPTVPNNSSLCHAVSSAHRPPREAPNMAAGPKAHSRPRWSAAAGRTTRDKYC